MTTELNLRKALLLSSRIEQDTEGGPSTVVARVLLPGVFPRRSLSVCRTFDDSEMAESLHAVLQKNLDREMNFAAYEIY